MTEMQYVIHKSSSFGLYLFRQYEIHEVEGVEVHRFGPMVVVPTNMTSSSADTEGDTRRSVAMEMTSIGGVLLMRSPKQQLNHTRADDIEVDAFDDMRITASRVEEGNTRRSVAMEMTLIRGALLARSPKQQLNRMRADSTAMDTSSDADNTTVFLRAEEEGASRSSATMEMTLISGTLARMFVRAVSVVHMQMVLRLMNLTRQKLSRRVQRRRAPRVAV